jgi:hypothetical protein
MMVEVKSTMEKRSRNKENGDEKERWNERRNVMGRTYLFHSLDVVRVSLGDMLLPLGHLGGSIISYDLHLPSDLQASGRG